MNINVKHLTPFENPIYITRPILPDLGKMAGKLGEIWDTHWLTNEGVQHRELEKRLSLYLKSPNLSLFNNGTIALLIGCQSLKLSGEVITTPFTFPATPHVLSWNKLKPVFCDLDPVTMTLDSSRVEALITPQTSAIMGVHVYGIPCDVFGLQKIADKYNLKIIYDAAHAFGVEINGAGIASFGDLTMFSFHATKLFHSAEGGALAYRAPFLKPEIDLLKNFGIKNEEEVVLPGLNGKMNEIQAALGLLVLDIVEEEKQKRAALRQVYYSELGEVPGLTLQFDSPGVCSSLQYFVIRIDPARFGCSRDEVFWRLKEYNVVTRKYFYPLCSEYPVYRDLASSNPANLKVAHQVVEQVLCLPFYGNLSLEDAAKICTLIKSLNSAG